MWLNFGHPMVRDMAWALFAPPLLSPDDLTCTWYDSDWYSAFTAHMAPFLSELEAKPGELETYIKSLKDRRLGKYFESLWHYCLEHSDRYRVLESNLQVFNGPKTLGELDLVVFDAEAKKTLHWEFAIKFYLGCHDLAQAKNWLGPNQTDRLDKKLEHLVNKQAVLHEQPEVAQELSYKGIKVDDCGVITKGRLYYPFTATVTNEIHPSINPGHLRGGWIEWSKFVALHKKQEAWCQVLMNSGWLAPPLTVNIPFMRISEVIESVQTGLIRLPVHIYIDSGVLNRGYWFIVGDNWLTWT